MTAKFHEGSFDFDDLLSQLRNMKKMGGLGSLMSMLPGIGRMKEKMAEANVDDSILARQEAIILSMTRKERKNLETFKRGAQAAHRQGFRHDRTGRQQTL